MVEDKPTLQSSQEFSRVIVVLNRPLYPRNVGMAARAMANLGLQHLVLIGERYSRFDKVKQGAAHAQSVISAVRRYSSLAEFEEKEGDGVRIALSGKDARLKIPDDLEACLTQLKKLPEHRIHDPGAPIYLMFGAEDSGLSAAELAVCNLVCRLPTYSAVNSYNLSHAVLLTVFILRRALKDAPNEMCAREFQIEEPAVQVHPTFYPSQSIKIWLEALGFNLKSPRVNIEKMLNRILISNSPTNDELRLLDKVLQQTIRKLKSATGERL